ncbi:MAG TPA: EamA family transporter, partial [candidate division WWE3 bacterium]|nr:EamA family transporter [candidate division WWE3 bacterium]
EAALFLYLEPVFAAPLAYLWLGESITPTFIIGAAVIAAGVILTEYRPPRVAHLRHR